MNFLKNNDLQINLINNKCRSYLNILNALDKCNDTKIKIKTYHILKKKVDSMVQMKGGFTLDPRLIDELGSKLYMFQLREIYNRPNISYNKIPSLTLSEPSKQRSSNQVLEIQSSNQQSSLESSSEQSSNQHSPSEQSSNQHSSSGQQSSSGQGSKQITPSYKYGSMVKPIKKTDLDTLNEADLQTQAGRYADDMIKALTELNKQLDSNTNFDTIEPIIADMMYNMMILGVVSDVNTKYNNTSIRENINNALSKIDIAADKMEVFGLKNINKYNSMITNVITKVFDNIPPIGTESKRQELTESVKLENIHSVSSLPNINIKNLKDESKDQLDAKLSTLYNKSNKYLKMLTSALKLYNSVDKEKMKILIGDYIYNGLQILLIRNLPIYNAPTQTLNTIFIEFIDNVKHFKQANPQHKQDLNNLIAEACDSAHAKFINIDDYPSKIFKHNVKDKTIKTILLTDS